MTTPFLLGWPGGSIESTLKLVGLVLLAYAIVLLLSMIVWVYRDIRSRTTDQTSQVVAVLLVAIFNVPGLMNLVAKEGPVLNTHAGVLVLSKAAGA